MPPAATRARLSAGQIAELAVVVAAGPAGVNASRLDGTVRTFLASRQLTAPLPGSRYPAHDWRATVHATASGVAAVRAAQGVPVDLNPTEALPLAVIAHATANGGAGPEQWPGSALALRVARTWRLVEQVRAPSRGVILGRPAYHLTDAGRDALRRHQRGGRTDVIEVNASTASMLEEVDRLKPGAGVGVLSPAAARSLQVCREAGWVRDGDVVPGGRARAVLLTDNGREVLKEWRAAQRARASQDRPPSWQVADLKVGQWVRLSNRKGNPGVGREWVKVVDVRHVERRNRAGLAHNYEVWAITASQPEPFLYLGRAVLRRVRFQVRP